MKTVKGLKNLYNRGVLFIILLSLILFGCGGNRVQKQIVYETNTVVVEPNSDMLRSCPVTKPIPKDQYLSLSMDEKEDRLTELTIDLYKNIKNCNDQLKELREWFEKQKLLYNKKEK